MAHLHESNSWEGEMMLRLLLENVQNFAFFVVDKQRQVLTWNKGAEQVLGYSAAEILGQFEDAFFVPEDIEQGVPEEELQQAEEKGQVEQDGWCVRKDGSRIWCNTVTIALWDEQQNLRGFAKLVRDRTEQKRHEESLRTSLAYSRAITETVREPLLVLDADFKVNTANRSFYQNFQVSQEETEGHLLYDLGNGQWDIPRLRRLLEEILPHNSSFDDFEVEHDFPVIGKRFMRLNARRIQREVNHTAFILLAIEDITERKRAEEERRKIETRFTSLVKNIKDHAIFTMDTSGHIRSWNVEAERILGYTEAEVIDQYFSIIFRTEDIEQNLPERELETAREKGRAEDERWHQRKNGERFWALGIVTPLYDTSGQHTGFSKILRDMTDRKRAEEALQAADRRKNEFLAMLSHELRNPLAPIRSGLELLALEHPDSETIELMQHQVDHLVRLVDDLLDMFRIMRGKIELRTEPIELSKVVSRAVSTVRHLVDSQQQTLSVSLPQEPIWLQADPVRLTQVIANILSNATKYTERGGKIWLTGQSEAEKAIIRVRDTGIGIDQELLAEIFDLFTQAERTPDRSQGGLGIGLSLVKQIVEMHGGQITAQSEGRNQGSEFTVKLPRLKEGKPTSLSAEKEAEKVVSQANYRILIVEDNRESARLLGLLLSKTGEHEIETAYDGLAAIENARKNHPHLILLDIGLPDIDGYEVARRLRQQPEFQDTFLVALTGYGTREDRQKASEAGFDEHLVKPPTLEQLEQVLHHPRLVERSRDWESLEIPKGQTSEKPTSPPIPTDEQLLEKKKEQAPAPSLTGQFLRELAHEFGNAILPLQMILQLLQQNPSSPTIAGEVRQMLEGHLPLMNHLREELRQAGRIARNALEPQPKNIEFTEIVHRAVEEVQPLIEKQEQQLEVRLPKPPVPLKADPEILQKALAELLGNAARYSEPGGQIVVLAEQENGELILKVRNTGEGISSDLLPYVFEPFVRGEKQFDFAGGNLGLGLTLVRQVAEKHGGSIQATSAGPGQGSEFVIKLPLLE